MCDNRSLQELLPAYLEQGLDEDVRKEIEAHLLLCADCAAELSLLRTMTGEPVPDPGEAFWAAMPDRVFRAVQDEKTKKKGIDLSRLTDWLTLPRWIWAPAALGILLLVSWFVVNPVRQSLTGQPAEEHAYNVAAPAQDPAFPNSAVSIGDLSLAELESIENWAAGQLTGLAPDAEPAIAGSSENDVNEELADLDTGEMDRLSTLLSQFGQEG